jgi:pyridoxine 4-dehydrogenase
MTTPTQRTFTVGGEFRVPRIGYGAMQLAGQGVIGLPDDVHGAIEVLRRAVDHGVRFFDTATPTARAPSTKSSDEHSAPSRTT